MFYTPKWKKEARLLAKGAPKFLLYKPYLLTPDPIQVNGLIAATVTATGAEGVRMVLETGVASVSMLQRKFRVGYSRAARIIDIMEQMGIVGPNIGSKPREILMTTEQVNARYFTKEN